MELTTEQRTTIKRAGIASVVIALVSVGSFTAGRFSAPLKVETREVERFSVLDLKTEDITRGMSFTKVDQRVIYKNIVTTVAESHDAGTVTTITDTSIERYGGALDGFVTEQEARVEVVHADREVLVEKTVTLQPDWRIGVLAGASLREPLIPIASSLVLGVSIERRIAGGFGCGAWLLTAGAAGAICSIAF